MGLSETLYIPIDCRGRCLNPDSPDEMAFGRLRAPISVGKSISYGELGSRFLTDATGERRKRQFRQNSAAFGPVAPIHLGNPGSSDRGERRT
jgi:hypothetical protein